MYMLFKEAPETAKLIIAGCMMQAGNTFTEHYTQVARIVYKNICDECELEVP